MIWKITAYNGTTAVYSLELSLAIERFLKENELSEWDIKAISALS